MKKSILYLSAITLVAGMTSCSDDYLNTKPQSTVDQSVIFSTTENAAMAINGICLAMVQQYGTGLTSSSGTQGMNGEGTLKTWYNEYTGIDYQKSNLTGWKNTINLNWTESMRSSYTIYPWHYCYKQISNANTILDQIDGVEGTDADKKFIKAQALTFRAYFYSTLVKYYSRRWSDKQGESRGVVLRLAPTRDQMPASTLKEVYVQIYQDLDDAIALYKESGKDRPNGDVWSPNEDVAHAVYSRAALNREDWQTAYDQAVLARRNYPLMTSDDYRSGFNAPNSEWIWEAYNDAGQTVHHYGFFSYNGSNTDTSAGRQYVPSISKELIEQIPENDSRRWCYLVPLESEENSYVKTNSGAARTDASKYDVSLYKRAKADYADYLYSSTTIYAYMSFKFRAVSGHSDGCINLFRSAEMIYNQAEAAYRIGGKESEVRSLLEEAVAPYQPGYTCDKSGEALLNEVKLYRRFDLWGEGFSWSDLKRWGSDHIRKTWTEGGSFHPDFCGTGSTGGCYGPSDKNHWTWVYPINETDYNKMVTTKEVD